MNIGSLNIEIHIESVKGDFQPAYHVLTGENVVIKRTGKGRKQLKASPKSLGRKTFQL
jgi:hypothetical protein